MRVTKTINNNVVCCLDDAGREAIAMGRGLGFMLRAGAELDEAQAEKIFRMETSEEQRRLSELFSRLDPQQIELCSKIVDYASEELGRRLCASIYLTLTDHLCFALERLRNGEVFQNPLLAEVRTFYPREYAVGKFALALLQRTLGAVFPDDEAASIAMHIVNAEYETSISNTVRITQALHDIVKTLKGWPGLGFSDESIFYDEFTVHLKFLVFRAFSGKCQTQEEAVFVRAVRRCYPLEFHCVEQITQGLSKRSGTQLPDAELAHLAAALHRTCVRPMQGEKKG